MCIYILIPTGNHEEKKNVRPIKVKMGWYSCDVMSRAMVMSFDKEAMSDDRNMAFDVGGCLARPSPPVRGHIAARQDVNSASHQGVNVRNLPRMSSVSDAKGRGCCWGLFVCVFLYMRWCLSVCEMRYVTVVV